MISADQQLSHPNFPDIERVQERFKRWRGMQGKRSRIPEELWQAAVEVARNHGINKTAHALRLDYYGLKKRINSARSAATVEKKAVSFMELVPAAVRASTACVVELESGSGTKMRIHFGAAPDVAWLRGLLFGVER
jgi:hypothetical protein